MLTTNHRIRRVCAAACATPLLVLGVAATAGAAQVTATPAATGAVQASSPGEILDLVNAERAKANCEPLKVDAKLQQAAQAHADDMAKNNITGHTGSDGSTSLSRMQAAGYDPQGPSAENVSWGFSDSKGHVDGWMKSTKGHRETILNCTYKETGVGVSGDYAVQLFAVKSQ
ncbi:CAP domain-containing protein [Streptomyces sp. NRRL S-87]|uniref:CAP domain-containing protein n=1 Tax=Streptomyces sp. NRRL S-87 TaxID=1463920 RepID=UPI0004BFBE7F|nr:CAP domain-containing protein [Streptomyces sp. NRRL S-87]